MTTWNPVLITLSLCLTTISFGGLTAWLNAGILYFFERPSANGLIILAREIMNAKREPYGATVAFRNQHFVGLSVSSWRKYWLGGATSPLGFVCTPAQACMEVVDTHRRKRLHFVPVCYSAYLKPLECRYCSRGSSPHCCRGMAERITSGWINATEKCQYVLKPSNRSWLSRCMRYTAMWQDATNILKALQLGLQAPVGWKLRQLKNDLQQF